MHYYCTVYCKLFVTFKREEEKSCLLATQVRPWIYRAAKEWKNHHDDEFQSDDFLLDFSEIFACDYDVTCEYNS